jgi:hypothetical protein
MVWRKVPDDLPCAVSVSIGLCGACEHLHLFLNDEAGKPFAQCILSDEMVQQIITHYLPVGLDDENHRH